jgi:UDP-GlcNAc3NAcA epimerase
MYDAALLFAEKAKRYSSVLKQLGIKKAGYILSTIHRAENTDSRIGLKNVLEALERVSLTIPVILPLHPRTVAKIKEFKLESCLKNVRIIIPVGFLDMISLESNARMIITDSGGIQKEAYFHRVPCLTIRSETEWVETIKAGWNRLADMKSAETIYKSAFQVLKLKSGKEIKEYGTGNAAETMCGIIGKFFR